METFPYLPGWALWYYFQNNSTPPDWVNAISAGIDCNGFVSRSVSYTGNKYKDYSNRNADVTKRTDWFTNPQYPYYKVVGTHSKIADKVAYYDDTDEDDDELILDLDKIKPGDFMYLENSNDTGKHIAMVLDVYISDDKVELKDIKLIESTWHTPGGTNPKKWAKVINSQQQNYYINSNWVIVRSKYEE